MQKTNIPWTEYTWNPSVGCELPLVSTGCANCYARQLHNTRHKAYMAGKKLPIQYAKPFEEIQLFPDRLDEPLHKRNPRSIFVGSMTDLFCPSVPFEFIDKVMAVIALTPHIYQVLTKRNERMLKYFTESNPIDGKYLETDTRIRVHRQALSMVHKSQQSQGKSLNMWDGRWPLPNLWLGVTAENQEMADKRIPILLQIPAAVRFVSIEPMLGPVDFAEIIEIRQFAGDGKGWPKEKRPIKMNVLYGHETESPEDDDNGKPIYYDAPTGAIPTLDRVIVGAESGPKRRFCKWQWIDSIVMQCREAGVPCFLKQVHDQKTGKLIKETAPKTYGWPREYPK